ncbi:MAG: GNAT family N-acetyltransferase [Pseudomonadota bacterium]
MKPNKPEISFRPVVQQDYRRLKSWMELPHWREWWGEPETELGLIREMVEGRDSTRPYLFLIDGVETGYIQYWIVKDHQNAEWVAKHPWLAELPANSIGIDLSIGDEKNLSKGLGSAVLKAFTKMLATKGYQTMIIDPDVNNLRAIRAYEKAGFSFVPSLEAIASDVHIMQLELNEKSI